MSVDDFSIKTAVVLLISILENTNSIVEFYILSSVCTKETKNLLSDLLSYSNCIINNVHVNKSLLNTFPPCLGKMRQRWFCTLIPKLLPDVEKIIWLDNDVLVRNDIQDLWNIDVSDFLVAAVEDVLFSALTAQDLKLKSGTYFNSGVLVINNKKWIKDKIYNYIYEYVMLHKGKTFNEQDVLNIVIDNDKLLISPKYNYIELMRTGILHGYSGQYSTDYENCKTGQAVIVNLSPKVLRLPILYFTYGLIHKLEKKYYLHLS